MDRLKIEGGNLSLSIEDRTFEEFHGITMACITLNEQEDIVGFLDHVKPYVQKIVMIDGGSTDKTVELAAPLVDNLIKVPFKGHLGNQKNMSISLVETDWTLFLDPDERLPEHVLKMLPELVNQDEFDCYTFPRMEYLSGKKNLLPYPDYQDRLFRTYCRYVRPIHHELVGYKKKYVFPINEGYDMIHSKRLERHKSRNSGHSLFEKKYKHEMSYPGAQLKETYIKKFPALNKKLVGEGNL